MKFRHCASALRTDSTFSVCDGQPVAASLSTVRKLLSVHKLLSVRKLLSVHKLLSVCKQQSVRNAE